MALAFLTILAAAAAYRLAKFNLDDTQQFGFKGVPTPAIGLLVASFPLIYWNTANRAVIDTLLNNWFLYALVVVLSWCMVSDLPVMALKFKDRSKTALAPLIILAAAGAIAAYLVGWMAVPIIFVLYILLSLAYKKKAS